MNCRLFRICALVATLLPAGWVQAAVTCTVGSAGVTTSYDPAAIVATTVQSQLTVTCQANVAGDLGAFTYSVGVNNGLYSTAGTNQANFGASNVRYDTWRESTCNTLWKNTPANSRRLPDPPPGALNLVGIGAPVSATANYWICIPAAQTGAATGLHTDIVTMTVYSGTSNSALNTGTLPVNIAVSSTCSITTPPGNVAFAYTSFGPAANASTTFATTCTSGLPYTMALDTTGGTLLGLNYSIALSAAGGTGTGVAQSYSIDGTMAAGQVGTCSAAICNASAPHTLIITY